MIFAIEWHHCACCNPWPLPTFSRSTFLNFNISKTMRARLKMHAMTLIEVDICHRVAHYEYCAHWPWPKFIRSNTWNVKILKNVIARVKTRAITYRDWLSPWNGVLANVALHDLDLNFQGKNLNNFGRFWYLPSKGLWKKLYTVHFTYF